MHDLNVIAKQNSAAAQAIIPQLQQQGKFVVAEFAGVHFMSAEGFDTQQQAEARLSELADKSPDTSGRLFLPFEQLRTPELAKDTDGVNAALAAGAKPVTEPAEPGPLTYTTVQVAALVIVDANGVNAIPPQVFAGVARKDNPNAVLALVGPASSLDSVRDAAVFASAFDLRTALKEFLAFVTSEPRSGPECQAAIDKAQAVLDQATPIFAATHAPANPNVQTASVDAGTGQVVEPDNLGAMVPANGEEPLPEIDGLADSPGKFEQLLEQKLQEPNQGITDDTATSDVS